MISVVIIDDEQVIRNTLKKIILAHNIPVNIIGEANSLLTGIEIITTHKPDIILLDVMLGNDTSFDMLRMLGKINSKVIFISGHDHLAIQAFKFSAIDYILKPVDPSELENAIDKAQKQIVNDQTSSNFEVLLSNVLNKNDQDKKIVLNTLDKTHVVPIQNILRCESSNNYTSFYLKNGENLLISKPIKQYDELLQSFDFFRVHKSHLVNLNFVKGIIKKDGGYVELINGDFIPISTRKKEQTMSLIYKMGVN